MNIAHVIFLHMITVINEWIVGAYPNYVMDGVIDGFPEMDPKIGISSLLSRPQLKGLWTWTRGGGMYRVIRWLLIGY